MLLSLEHAEHCCAEKKPDTVVFIELFAGYRSSDLYRMAYLRQMWEEVGSLARLWLRLSFSFRSAAMRSRHMSFYSLE